ncbi:putative cinnamoyl-CoA reductase [Truncatella angustata]|uniref:Cinnamoyl-CoA reductase n=1 Tax=Truncatella angustata TaxID=152316 RepID=A0A9P8RR17_9PEZI|nr:putative cinnamoyl-CoA reductase [Truncatella angustata]KAH6647952.1 putative cinnamoyl-CoA reductase [Truncatella angustata]
MSSPNLLITGVTGFIGFNVLTTALQEGYTVRAAVRSIEKSKAISSHPKVLALGGHDKLSFVEIPDICREGAYDEALKGISYIIHQASPLPLPFLDPQTEIYEPTIKGVSTILQSALNAPTVKKVVITSSSFANTFPPDPTKQVTAESRVPDLPGPFDSALPAYGAGKVAALNLTDRFVKEKQPSFAVVNIFPGIVLGRDDRALNVQDLSAGTNMILLAVITGQSASWPLTSGVADVSDVAKAHVLALKEDVVKDIGVTTAHQFNDAWNFVEKHFPKAVADGIFTQGDQPTVPSCWDAYKNELDLGSNYNTYEDIVVNVASQYLELSGKEKA